MELDPSGFALTISSKRTSWKVSVFCSTVNILLNLCIYLNNNRYPEEAEEHCNPLHQLAGGKVESIKQNRLLRFGMPLQRHQEYGKVSLHDIESLAEMGKHTGLCGG